MAEDSLKTLELQTPDPSAPSRVFLEATLKNEGFFPMMPHSMYCLPLWPGITMVLLTKVMVLLNIVGYENQRNRNLVCDSEKSENATRFCTLLVNMKIDNITFI